MSKPDVKCVVNSCTHYLPGDLCGAGKIDILNEEVNEMSQTAQETMCKTFAHRRGLANMLGSMDNVDWSGAVVGAFKEGQQLKPSVTCVVDTCRFWEDEDRCVAESIEITGRDAKECQDTDCITFRKG